MLSRIIDTLSAPPVAMTSVKVKEMFETGKGDILKDFSDSCRGELEALREQQF